MAGDDAASAARGVSICLPALGKWQGPHDATHTQGRHGRQACVRPALRHGYILCVSMQTLSFRSRPGWRLRVKCAVHGAV